LNKTNDLNHFIGYLSDAFARKYKRSFYADNIKIKSRGVYKKKLLGYAISALSMTHRLHSYIFDLIILLFVSAAVFVV
jgi:hypothetical protein